MSPLSVALGIMSKPIVQLPPQKVAVFGGGSFGTAMAVAVARNGHRVAILVRDAQVANEINTQHTNSKYIGDLPLPHNVTATTDINEALAGVSFIFHAIPAQTTFDFLEHRKTVIPADVPIISTSKGISTESLKLMSDLIPEALGRTNQPLAYLSGPSFAKEVIQNLPTAVVVASVATEVAQRVQCLMSSTTFRVYTTDDVTGVEVGGALKNPLAIGAGVIHGMGFGNNALAILVTRGCSEMKKLAIQLGGKPETLAGLSGFGDLMLTCHSAMSRNRTVGYRLGKGETLQAILASMAEVAEGVPTAGAVVRLAAREKLDLPIFKAIGDLLDGKLAAMQALEHLMTLPLRAED
ncbi:glycerol-3-phosphate dehydrogenase [Capsaspora owczarzaki ATCC 30864]|uniref:Glycerol-3-phosphate dehydrogenase [NAD(+)] n=1 Tax=Capsaspora owczarzaki (strain ATCC 30864) TaxID=595528 RepID=A0A0D2WJZ6_CAPO3|nr:glycerol-3-phosphate dehydrogenase [Capsaspora owczarzaki ATCC 30864]KJE89828.1 glycerol-3-phosphate dehydrogenase [Capsaspora owczarzaki ATCC 30864]|eukprot:XP_004349769.2 glycerol-3-phosphate dehydrogenase [Capsaspora owczarzaki ATCC 30864]